MIARFTAPFLPLKNSLGTEETLHPVRDPERLVLNLRYGRIGKRLERATWPPEVAEEDGRGRR